MLELVMTSDTAAAEQLPSSLDEARHLFSTCDSSRLGWREKLEFPSIS